MDLNASLCSRSVFLGSSKPNVQNIKFSLNIADQPTIPRLGRRLSAAKSTPKTDIYASSGVELQATDEFKEIVNPVYVPTPANRALRTPHSGYHFDGTTRKFFEGWYFKVSIPEQRQSFCFMYSVENPAFKKKLNSLEQAQYGPRFTGVGAQILGADDKYICQYTEESQKFWGSRHELMLGNSFTVQTGKQPPNNEVPPQVFYQSVIEGFQVSPLWHQGFIRDDGRTTYAETVKTARWEYSTHPFYGWGDVGSKQKSTAGWLAAFPVFEPHWQICMAGGLSTGWIEWGEERFEFQNAPSYCEKNWGGGFPRKWFWVQCNVFKGANGEVSLTCGGGLRQLPGLNETFENAALIGVHFGGIFYEFVPWNGVVEWEVAQWGYWHVTADNETHQRSMGEEDGYVQALITATLSSSILHLARNSSSASSLWKAIEDSFVQIVFAKQSQLQTQFYILKQNTKSVVFQNESKETVDSLNAIGDPISDDLLVLQVLQGLNVDFENFVMNIENMEKTLTFFQLRSELLTYEARLKQRQSSVQSLLAAMTASTINPPYANSSKAIVCQICAKSGHKASNCSCTHTDLTVPPMVDLVEQVDVAIASKESAVDMVVVAVVRSGSLLVALPLISLMFILMVAILI